GFVCHRRRLPNRSHRVSSPTRGVVSSYACWSTCRRKTVFQVHLVRRDHPPVIQVPRVFAPGGTTNRSRTNHTARPRTPDRSPPRLRERWSTASRGRTTDRTTLKYRE